MALLPNLKDEKKAKEIWPQKKILLIAKIIPNLRDRTLFVLEYLTGGRVSEIVQRVQPTDFEVHAINNKKFLRVYNFYTAKNRKHPDRVLDIPIHKEGEFVDILQTYMQSLKPDDFVFAMTRQRAWQIISKILLQYKPKSTTNKFMNGNHFLRHCRNTHLYRIYGFDQYDLMKWNGWSSTAPADKYVHGEDEFIKKMS